MAKTRILSLDPERVSKDELAGIAGALLDGAVAAYPTETYYALGAAAFSRRAVDRIFRLKGRETSKPLSFIASGMDMVRELVATTPGGFLLLAGALWPGPLTLVLPAAAGLPDRLLGPGRTIALRVPPLAWLRSLVGELGGPLTATSANKSGEGELADPGEVRALFEGRI
ncbi:MAG: L-threonylcarbamoyladenylate synthase, partial [Candidatus Aminicenantes bacterium]|nr:L-threonylcarbamoyladenylate synthase [Candidatus Aminicenantes bacterium]